MCGCANLFLGCVIAVYGWVCWLLPRAAAYGRNEGKCQWDIAAWKVLGKDLSVGLNGQSPGTVKCLRGSGPQTPCGSLHFPLSCPCHHLSCVPCDVAVRCHLHSTHQPTQRVGKLGSDSSTSPAGGISAVSKHLLC